MQKSPVLLHVKLAVYDTAYCYAWFHTHTHARMTQKNHFATYLLYGPIPIPAFAYATENS